MTTPRILALCLLVLLPRLASAQTAPFDIDRNIAEYEDTLRKIRDQGWVWIPVPDAGAFISRDAEAGLFSQMILLGMLHPDSVASKHRELRAMTRNVEAEIVAALENLRALQRERELGPPPPQVRPADRARGSVSGTWAVACWSGNTPLNESGTFTLQLIGNGNVSGSYTGPSGTFTVGGSVDEAGNIQGQGNHPDGFFQYFARVQAVGESLRLLSGNVLFRPSDPEITCSGGSLTPP